MSPSLRVATIPTGAPFLTTLAEALLDGRLIPGLAGPAALADATIYLPTQRAARAFARILSAKSGRALLLPRIVPLGEIEENTEEAGEAAGNDAEPPPIGPLARRLILTRLVQEWARKVDRRLLRLAPDAPLLVPSSPAEAAVLADDLAALMDSLCIEGIEWSELANAVEADFSRYFELTLAFVAVAAKAWPDILKERGASDPVARRNRLLLAEADRLVRERPTAPIVAAGSTGSIPATAALLAAIAGLPAGAVVLPGLDTSLDDPAWERIGGIEPHDGDDTVHGHPQAALHRLVTKVFKLTRAEIETLEPPAFDPSRGKLLSQALRPADSTESWAHLSGEAREALTGGGLGGIALVEAGDEHEEAVAAAAAVRECLERAGARALVVTPDRGLARRIGIELERWGIAARDSAGTALAETRIGRLARLVAEAAAAEFDPLSVVALLAHPDCRLAFPRATLERAAAALEIAALRGPAPRPGIAGLRAALERARAEASPRDSGPRRRVGEEGFSLAAQLLDRLEAAFAGFTRNDHPGAPLDLVRLAERHRASFAALAARPEDEEAEDDPAREVLDAFFDELAAGGCGLVGGGFPDYPAFFATLARATVPAPRGRETPRVEIMGLLEARLLEADRVILAGLDEGVWPPRATTDAFLNRPMRARIGLSPPERRIGQTAHDFVELLGARDVVITRAARRGGSPTVPSRFLQRLKAFCGEKAFAAVTGRGAFYRDCALALEAPIASPPLKRPGPKPNPPRFPDQLSVTAIETLMRDPYAIYARHILKLDPLEDLAADPGAAERGTLVHDVFGDFAKAFPDALPADALGELLRRGEAKLAPIRRDFPQVYAAWWPRFRRMAKAYLEWEEERRAGRGLTIHAERGGKLPLGLPDGATFHLTARADRIEMRGGQAAIIDFKTGTPPSDKEIFAGFAPQLTLEAAMVLENAFKDFPKAAGIEELLYVHVTGGREPIKPRAVKTPKGRTETVEDIVAIHRANLVARIAEYRAGAIGFHSKPHPKFTSDWGDYDHLARVAEWMAAADEEEA